MTETLLNEYSRVVPNFQHLTVNDINIAVSDREKYIMVKPGKKFDLKVSVGDPLRENSIIVNAMKNKRRVIGRGNKDLFGYPYIAIAYPIFDDQGEVIGGMVAVESVERQELFQVMANKMSDAISNLASTAEEISAQTEEIASVCSQMTEVVQESDKRVKETDGVLEIIRTVAGQTNLLGLNAAIEAARAGHAGRGFSVVAEEIRKLSSSTTESVQKIANIIRTIQADSSYTFKQLSQLNEVISQVAQATSQVALSVEQISTLSTELDSMAKMLSSDESG